MGKSKKEMTPEEIEESIREEHLMFQKTLPETGSLDKTWDIMTKWLDEHGGPKGPPIDTNNYHQAEFEFDHMKAVLDDMWENGKRTPEERLEDLRDIEENRKYVEGLRDYAIKHGKA